MNSRDTDYIDALDDGLDLLRTAWLALLADDLEDETSAAAIRSTVWVAIKMLKDTRDRIEASGAKGGS